MSTLREALLFLDLDKGKGPSLEEQGRRLRSDPHLRSGWSQYQALRALSFETAPAPDEKMVQSVLSQCRREAVGRQLSQIAGGDEAAREILLGKGSRGLAPWMLGLLLAGALGLGWTVFHGEGPAGHTDSPLSPSADAGSLLSPQTDAVPFEFPVQTPPEAALSAPPGEAPNADGADDSDDADDVHTEAPAERQASRLLREHLHEAEARDQEPAEPSPVAAAAPELKAPVAVDAFPAMAALAPPLALPSPTSAVAPAAALPVPSPLPAVRPVGVKKAAARRAPRTRSWSAAVKKTAAAKAGPVVPASAREVRVRTLGPPVPAGLTLSADTLAAAPEASPRTPTDANTQTNESGLDVVVGMPERRDIDVRFFSPSGKAARVLAVGSYGPGTVHFLLDSKDDHDRTLAPGTYYLRVMTPWFSRVEPIQIH